MVTYGLLTGLNNVELASMNNIVLASMNNVEQVNMNNVVMQQCCYNIILIIIFGIYTRCQ